MLDFHWSHYSSYFSAAYTQKYLFAKYRKNNIENAQQLAYENCYPFMYYLEHGKTYYLQAENCPLIIQPILLYYGFVHLIKALILTISPNYPETTSVLAHGVSARKRKKQDFLFYQDEVKIQKNGLFPFMAEQLFHMKHLEGEKFTMYDLLCQIPEMNSIFSKLESKTTFLPIKRARNIYYFPKEVLDHFHMTVNRFTEYFSLKSKNTYHFKQETKNSLVFEKTTDAYDIALPLRYHLDDKKWMLPVSKKWLEIHEILIHYLLLYNLSMVARYETEWWSELVKNMPNKDYPLIEVFLTKTLTKGPFLILQELLIE